MGDVINFNIMFDLKSKILAALVNFSASFLYFSDSAATCDKYNLTDTESLKRVGDVVVVPLGFSGVGLLT